MSSEKKESRREQILRMSNEESNRFTKECICTALILLMNEQDFEKITISSIIKRAGVSRGAFYRNYSSKEDILREFDLKLAEEVFMICVTSCLVRHCQLLLRQLHLL